MVIQIIQLFQRFPKVKALSDEALNREFAAAALNLKHYQQKANARERRASTGYMLAIERELAGRAKRQAKRKNAHLPARLAPSWCNQLQESLPGEGLEF